MKELTEKLFFLLLKKTIGNIKNVDIPKETDFGELYTLSNFHGLAHLIYYELDGISRFEGDASYDAFRKQYLVANARHIQRTVAIDEIKRLLDTAKVPYILLKGTVLMDLYPKSWMRTSSDIDVLVRQEDYHRVIKIFLNAGMDKINETMHDISFASSDRYHIELHHTLIEGHRYPKMVAVLDRVWDFVEGAREGSSEYRMIDEMFYYYHIAHMVKHFENGGCGVRTFFDLWFLEHNVQFDKSKRDSLLREGGILTFAEMARKLTENWFSFAKNQDLKVFSSFVLSGGVYGTIARRVKIQKIKSGSTLKYIFKRIFLSYNQMKYYYPTLSDIPVLLPFFWIVRCFKMALNPRSRKRVVYEIKNDNSTDYEFDKRVEILMKELEIW